MALTGMNLCKSAKDSQKLIYKKGSRYVFTMITGMAFRFVGVVFIAGATGGFMYFMLHNYVPWVGLAVNWINPTIIASLIGLIIAGPFMSVLNIASETKNLDTHATSKIVSSGKAFPVGRNRSRQELF